MKQPITTKWNDLTERQRKQALNMLDDRLNLQKDAPNKLYKHNVYAMSFHVHSKTGAVVN